MFTKVINKPSGLLIKVSGVEVNTVNPNIKYPEIKGNIIEIKINERYCRILFM